MKIKIENSEITLSEDLIKHIADNDGHAELNTRTNTMSIGYWGFEIKYFEDDPMSGRETMLLINSEIDKIKGNT